MHRTIQITAINQPEAAMFSFECSVCSEGFTEPTTPRKIDGDPICHDCVLESLPPRFEAALNNPLDYPVRWGKGVEVNADDFEDILSADFVARYHRREVEYNTPATDRFYCKHKVLQSRKPKIGGTPPDEPIFLKPEQIDVAQGEAVDCGAMRGANPDPSLVCYHCLGQHCRSCRSPIYEMTAGSHVCTGPPVTIQLTEIEGLQRGRDYQYCPNETCHNPVSLHDGCNHMTCPEPGCRTEFCYICGLEAREGTGHWSEGGCPRYNQPGPNAFFDDDEDDDDFAEFEEWDFLARPSSNPVEAAETARFDQEAMQAMDAAPNAPWLARALLSNLLRNFRTMRRTLDSLHQAQNLEHVLYSFNLTTEYIRCVWQWLNHALFVDLPQPLQESLRLYFGLHERNEDNFTMRLEILFVRNNTEHCIWPDGWLVNPTQRQDIVGSTAEYHAALGRELNSVGQRVQLDDHGDQFAFYERLYTSVLDALPLTRLTHEELENLDLVAREKFRNALRLVAGIHLTGREKVLPLLARTQTLLLERTGQLSQDDEQRRFKGVWENRLVGRSEPLV
ncbi:hypothetical protein BAUCODRAFT_192425 [Baudoinia panamericana UAMH 10762]|uniref:RBR-type E3 ubiquitin transferase n=1 Tax=Baudoinia panamericana (strain UAMH 10762) TaxID=717646 RepID=M2NNE8_BAUPA|nr:uncharacterized protein BAUCODRAFT_192425 [Baudoinia panamericana UAMH 10762]EMD01010.1 hypothetical protein BAUCODRAFT_192425 [Baudoinia panamericana UAMH 10762]